MSHSVIPLQPVRTIESTHSVWSLVSEDDFRRHLVMLEELTNAVPRDVLVTDLDGINDEEDEGWLPIKVEKQIADDLAFIVAITEGAQSVAAVCLEQHYGNHESTLLIKITGMDVVDQKVRDMLDSVIIVLGRLSRNSIDRTIAADEIFKLIIHRHTQKLLGRLRSRKWEKPQYLSLTHKKSLWQDFENVIHRVQHIYPKRSQRPKREVVESQLISLSKIYVDFESTMDDQVSQNLQKLVKATYDFCQSVEIAILVSKLENVRPTTQIAGALKTLRQLEKIGAYWRIATGLVQTSHKYPQIFQHISLDYLRPYASIPTPIAYESWAKTCHVHAEIQLVVDRLLHTPEAKVNTNRIISSRTIGTSKYLCYLCHLFLTYHGGFVLLNTHGRLYDQWTVPNLEAYDEQTRDRIAHTLKQMDDHICKQIEDINEPVWRVEPMTSRQNLLCLPAELKNETC